MLAAPLQLGFAEPLLAAAVDCLDLSSSESTEPQTDLPASDFPSKIGGRPTFLNPLKPLPVDAATCGVCSTPMALLMQIYTPEDDFDDAAYHRMLHVFCCKNGACHGKDWKECFRVYRSQLPRENDFWEEDIPDMEEIEEGDCEKVLNVISTTTTPASKKIFEPASTCVVCGLAAPKTCSKCRTTRYCSKIHQTYHWSEACHRKLCGKTTTTTTDDAVPPEVLSLDRSLLTRKNFPVFEIVSEPEETDKDEKEDTGKDGDEDEDEKEDVGGDADGMYVKGRSRRPPAEAAAASGTLAVFNAADEGYEKTKVEVDAAFLKFQKRIAKAPEQILRYARVGRADEDDEDEEDEVNEEDGSERKDGEEVEKVEKEETEDDAKLSADIISREMDDLTEPLWVSDFGKPEVQETIEERDETNGDDDEEVIELVDVPRCEGCGKAREFEMQMLNHLSIDHANPDALDWGTLMIYTCPANCENDVRRRRRRQEEDPDQFYREVIWRQDFSEDGIGARLRKSSAPPMDAEG